MFSAAFFLSLCWVSVFEELFRFLLRSRKPSSDAFGVSSVVAVFCFWLALIFA
jgi:hypothetical protein